VNKRDKIIFAIAVVAGLLELAVQFAHSFGRLSDSFPYRRVFYAFNIVFFVAFMWLLIQQRRRRSS
jgi:hypothetical protein